MSNPALTLAIFEKLTGYPFDSEGRPMLNSETQEPANRHNSRGMRIPTPIDPSTRGVLSTDHPSAIRLWGEGYAREATTHVKVFHYGVNSSDWRETLPSVSFQPTDLQVGGLPYYSPTDHVREPTGDISESFNPATGTVLYGPTRRTKRTNPEPFTLYYAITLRAAFPTELEWLERCLLKLFGAKGMILVERSNNDYGPVNYSLERVAFIDRGEGYNVNANQGPTEDRSLMRVYTYAFQTSLDNFVPGWLTDEIPSENTILHRILEITNLQTKLSTGRLDLETLRSK